MSKTLPVLVPHENVNDESLRLLSWLVSDGARVEKDQPLAEVEGSKAKFDIHAPAAGIIRHRHQEDEEIAVGGILCVLETDEAETGEKAATLAPVAAAPVMEHGPREFPVGPRFSKKAAKLIEERGLAREQFQQFELVREQDVRAVLGERELPRRVEAPTVSPAPRTPPSRPASSAAVSGVASHRELLPRMKLIEIRYLQAGQQNALPSFVSLMVPTRGLRAALRLNPDLGDNGTALFVYETARLLRKHPLLNACYVEGEAHVYDAVNIGVAIDAGRGLKVAVVRDADTKTLPQIAAELREYVIQYLNDEIAVEALAAGTFTITDLSSENVFQFVPLLNQGQSAILGIGGEFFPPGGKDGVFSLALTFDHRLTEGRPVGRFLNDLRERLVHYESVLQTSEPVAAKAAPSCSKCFRTPAELRQDGWVLLSTVNDDDAVVLVCSMCLGGWT
jgi:pyruvate/2-oxoglutarate dehydrogenase complex dihydrolipoamide acyltransferase (E2) component